MAGIASGKPWSRIGVETAPTSSAAPGVWGDLNEVAEYVGASTWPAPQEAYELLSTTTVSTATQSITLTSIPQAYRDLKLVIRAASLDLVEDSTWIQLNGDSTNTNYRLYYYGAGGNSSSSGTYEATHYAYNSNQMPRGNWPWGSSSRGSLNERQAAEFHIPNYTAVSATSGTGVYCFASGVNNIGTPQNNQWFQWSGQSWTGTTAVTSIVVYQNGSGSLYEYQPNTQVSLYGIGTAP